MVTNISSWPAVPCTSVPFSLVSAPAGVNLDPISGVLTWTPSEAQGPSTNPITVRVTDNGTPPLNDTRTFTVVISEMNTAPSLTVPADQTINELSTLMERKSTSQNYMHSHAFTFRLVSAPAALNLHPISAVPTRRSSELQGPSTNPITVRVTDNGTPPLNDTRTFTVVVSEMNTAPLLTVPADQTINELSTL